MSAREGALWIVFNGMIHNFLELREQLRQLGHTFHSRTDTEVILNAYIEWGPGCVEHFNGMWAFVLWDGRHRELFVSRDRLGIKRLLVATAGPVVAFASELVISATMMAMVLRTSASERWKRYTGLFAALLVATYITVEAPLSGMSMNPARTVASALAANRWMSWWVYFVAPLAGMLIAAELFLRARGSVPIPCGKIVHAEPCLFCEHVAAHNAER